MAISCCAFAKVWVWRFTLVDSSHLTGNRFSYSSFHDHHAFIDLTPYLRQRFSFQEALAHHNLPIRNKQKTKQVNCITPSRFPIESFRINVTPRNVVKCSNQKSFFSSISDFICFIDRNGSIWVQRAQNTHLTNVRDNVRFHLLKMSVW